MKFLSPMILVFCLSISLGPVTFAEETSHQPKKPDHDHIYKQCLRLADTAPKDALAKAQGWLIDGGATGARHCIATAQFNLGQFENAAKAFEKLAEEIDLGSFDQEFSAKYRKHLKSELLFQSGVAWVEANQLNRGYMSFSSALIGVGKETEFARRTYVERGLIEESHRKYDKALVEFSRAIDIDAGIPEVYIYRGHVRRIKGQLLLARQDIDLALDITPDDVNALLESGILYRLSEDQSKARTAWEKIIKLDKNSEMTKLAQENIKLLTLKN